MRVPLSWLSDFVEVKGSAETVADLLTTAGLEVKTISYVGLPGAPLAWDADKLFLAHLLKVERHPNADKLVMATVDYGAEAPKVVITGAPNLFEYLGRDDLADEQLYSPIILEGGTYLNPYKKGKPTVLKGKPLRGIHNDAMLCSEVELGLGDDYDGIILMKKDGDSPDYKPGIPLVELLGDAVLDIDIIPNIARCASILGVAREYAALTNQTLRLPDFNVVAEGPPLDGKIAISTENPEWNPRFTAMLIEGVSQTKSPFWMRHKLQLAGQRPINVVVDISNYVMLEIGQPNHTFDYDFLRERANGYAPDGPVHLVTRTPRDSETMTTLDEIEHKLLPFNMLVTDEAGILSLGGIMGGANSEIKPETTNVLLESAAWNFINIRRSGTKLNIHTDAYFRFSRGVHPSQAILGVQRAAELLRRLAGGTVAKGMVDSYPLPPQAVTIALDPQDVRRWSGLSLSADEIAELLARLDFAIVRDGDHLQVTVPDHRMDVEGPQDLVEEVCRLYGYDNIPTTMISDVLPSTPQGDPTLPMEEHIRDWLAQSGLQEVITYRLISAESETKLLPNSKPDDRPYVALTNPLSPQRAVMRHTLLNSVLEIAARNSRNQDRIALFEIGPIFIMDEESPLPEEISRLCTVLTGRRASAFWHDEAAPMLDFFDLKGVVERLFAKMQLDVRYVAGEHPSFRPGRTARLYLGDLNFGVMGELHPQVVAAYGVKVDGDQPVLAADFDLSAIINKAGSAFKYESVSVYPPVRQDLALVVDDGLDSAEVEAAIRKAGGFLLRGAVLFDVYQGKNIPAGKKSLAYHLTFQSPSKTLTDKDMAKQRKRLLYLLDKNIGAKLR